MTLEAELLAYITEACKWCKPSTNMLVAASEESQTPAQVHNALSRLRRKRQVRYVGARGRGYWITP